MISKFFFDSFLIGYYKPSYKIFPSSLNTFFFVLIKPAKNSNLESGIHHLYVTMETTFYFNIAFFSPSVYFLKIYEIGNVLGQALIIDICEANTVQ